MKNSMCSLFLLTMIFLSLNIAQANHDSAGRNMVYNQDPIKIQQIRNATLIINYGGSRFLLDPMLAPKGSFTAWKGTPNAHLKNPLSDLPISIDEIINVDAVIITHLHIDHFDKVAMERIPKSMPLFCQNTDDFHTLKQAGFQNITILTEKGVTFEEVTLIKTPAQHYSDIALVEMSKKRNVSMEACGVLFKHSKEKTLYVMGDTVWYKGLLVPLQQYNPEIIVVNAGHAKTLEGISLIMGAADVYEVAKHAPNAKILATHMEGLNHLTLTRDGLRKYAKENNFLPMLTIPEDGKVVTY